MEIVEAKVCGNCGRKLKAGTTRCPACNSNAYRRKPRLLFGMGLVLIFAIFCAILYYLAHNRLRLYAWLTSLTLSPWLLSLDMV